MYEPKPYGQHPQAAPPTAPPPPAYGYSQQPWPPSAPPPTMGVPVGTPGRSPFSTHQGQWTTGLCGCCEDCGNCWMTCCCPCITFGRIAEIVDRGSTSCGASGALYFLLTWLTCCHWIYSCSYRSKLRGQYNLWSRPCNDCLVHFCCEPCALCQEYRELKNRGFDMQIGWYANANRQANGMTTPPVVPGGMMR